MQTIRILRCMARDLGIPLPELIRRRASKQDMVACADRDGLVQIKPRSLVSRMPLKWEK